MSDIPEAMHELQETHCEEMEECELLELYNHIPPMLHFVRLLWANSSYYQDPSKIAVLLQEISNLMITLMFIDVHVQLYIIYK